MKAILATDSDIYGTKQIVYHKIAWINTKWVKLSILLMQMDDTLITTVLLKCYGSTRNYGSELGMQHRDYHLSLVYKLYINQKRTDRAIDKERKMG